MAKARRPPDRRPVRHLPGRPVPADGRLCRGQAAGGRRLHGRGAGGADLLRPAGLQFRRPRATPRPSPRQVIAAFEPLRLRRRAVGLLRRHAARCTIPDCSPTTRHGQARASASPAKVLRAGQLPRRRARHDRGRRRASTARSPITIPARACASSASATAAPAARVGRRAEAHRAAGRRGLLRLRRHVLRQISGHLQRHRREEDRERSPRPAPTRCSPAISAA